LERRQATSLLSQCKTFAYGQAIQARREARSAGAEEALAKTAKLLDVTMEGRFGTRHGHTADHHIELHGTVECYGACHRAPMCRVGDDYVENLKTDADLDIDDSIPF
jgi:hypothetical protein